MGSSRDFVAATLADALLPAFRRPVEDVIYETLDDRQIPTRTDFKELRDLVNSLRGQLTGATGGVKKLAERADELEERIDGLEERLAAFDGLAARVSALEARPVTAPAATSAPSPAPAAAPANNNSCKVPDCEDKARARGFCARHYQKWRRGTLPGFPAPE